jgi:hypothetical protein
MGRVAVLAQGAANNATTNIAYFQTATIVESGKNVMEYTCNATNADWPAIAFPGNKVGTIDIDILYVDNTYVTYLESNQNPLWVIISPGGTSTGSGEAKDTYQCLVAKWQAKIDQGKVTIGSISLDIIAIPTHTTY